LDRECHKLLWQGRNEFLCGPTGRNSIVSGIPSIPLRSMLGYFLFLPPGEEKQHGGERSHVFIVRAEGEIICKWEEEPGCALKT
jgi:hypothetical protein